MHSDTYMKAVLTVIAMCLVWICVRDVTLVKPAYAQSQFGSAPMKIHVTNEKLNVNIDAFAGKPFISLSTGKTWLLPGERPFTQDVEVKNWPSSLE